MALRRHIAGREESDDPESDVLNASQPENNWEGDLGTPLNTRGKRSKPNATNPKGNNLTLRDQEKVRASPTRADFIDDFAISTSIISRKKTST